MKKVITIIAMLGLTGGAYAAEYAIKALNAQVPETAELSVPAVAPASAASVEASPLQQEYAKRAELFQTGSLVHIGDLAGGGNLFGVRHADLLSIGKDGQLKQGEVYLSVIAQDGGRFANAEPVYGISVKLNSEFYYQADYVAYNYVALNTLNMNVSPDNKGVAGIMVKAVEYKGKKVLLARFTEKYLSRQGEKEYVGYSFLDLKK